MKRETDTTVAFRAPASLVEALDRLAAAEGISRADVARRACLRDAMINLQTPAKT